MLVFEFADGPPTVKIEPVTREVWSEVSYLEWMLGVRPVLLRVETLPIPGRQVIQPLKLKGFTQKDIDDQDTWFVWAGKQEKRPPFPKQLIKIGQYTLHGVFPVKMLDEVVADCRLDHFTID